MSVIIVRSILKRCNNDAVKAAEVIYANYQRGVYTQAEYIEYTNVLSTLNHILTQFSKRCYNTNGLTRKIKSSMWAMA